MRKVLLLVLLIAAVLVLNGLPLLAQEEFVFGMVLVGPKNDRGWSQSHYEGGLYVEQQIPGAKMLVYEGLNPVDSPETTLLDVTREMTEQGAQLIFTTSAEFQDETNSVAAQFPDVTFIHTTGDAVLLGTAPSNVGNYNSWFEMGRAISGCAAAVTTETGKIGYVGALINPETRRHASSAYLGARYCYEKFAGGDPAELEFTVTWIGFWFNIPGVTLDPTVVSNDFFNNGADVVISGIDTTEPLQVASRLSQEGNVAFAMPTDNPKGCDEAPDICLGSSYYNWGPPYTRIAQSVIDGTWEQKWDFEPPAYDDINNLDVSPVGFTFGPGLSEEGTAAVEQFIADMAAYGTDPANAESMFLWSGPLNYQDGTVLAAEGETVDILTIWRLEQLLEGMIGPSSSE